MIKELIWGYQVEKVMTGHLIVLTTEEGEEVEVEDPADQYLVPYHLNHKRIVS